MYDEARVRIDKDKLSQWVGAEVAKTSQGKMAKELGVAQPTIYRWLHGKIEAISGKQINAIAQYRKESVDDVVNWLGVKESLKVDQQVAARSFESADLTYIPLFGVFAGAGNGTVVDGEGIEQVIAFPKVWIQNELKVNPNHLEAIQIAGDSMMPLKSGDIVLIDRSDHVIRDGVFAMRIDGELWVKRLSRLPGNQVEVRSDNPSYSSFVIQLAAPPDDFEVLGRVVWAGMRYS